MNIFSVLTLIGGLAMFLFGMNTMGEGLVKVSGGKLDAVMERLTSNRLKAVLLGTAVTAIIQSSSATTVMVVGFVNSGIMKLSQAVGVIMGANVGTTVTSWLLSLTGISGNSFLLTMLKPSSFAPILGAVGIVLMMTAKGNARKKDISMILLGFTVLMAGMSTMSGSMEPLADNPQFVSILTVFSNPILGVLVGAALTAVIQSSSASIGILQALAITGIVPYSSAIPIIMGQNIGTCVTALLSAVGAGKNAKRASMIHLYFNLIGTALFMAVFYTVNHFVGFAFLSQPASAAGIAVVHSLFNIGCCIVMFPFGNLLVKLATITIPDRKKEGLAEEELPSELAALDERFLEKPAFAVQVCWDTSVKMAELSRDAVELAVSLIKDYSEKGAEQVLAQEQLVDQFQETLGSYLMQVNSANLSAGDSRQVSVMLQCIMDFERIADHAANIKFSMDDMQEQNVEIIDGTMKELLAYAGTVQTVIDQMILAFRTNDLMTVENIASYRKVIEEMSLALKQHDIDRLRDGKSTLEAGLILEDILTDFERIYAHCSSVGGCLLRSSSWNGLEIPASAG